jgi:hypothetical protein
MKILLALSLLANLVFAFFLFKPIQTQPPLERLIIEEHLRDEKVPGPEAPAIIQKSEETTQVYSADLNQLEIDERVKNIESEKREFLKHELEMSAEDMKKIRRIRERFTSEVEKLLPKSPVADLSIEKRRQILDLEEAREEAIQDVFGKRRWDKFQKFKEKYNRRQLKKSSGEDGFIIPMEI